MTECDGPADPVTGRPEAGNSVRAAIAEDMPVLVVIGVFVAASLLLHAGTGYPARIDLRASWRLFLIFSLLYAAGAALVMLVHTVVVRKQSLRHLETWRGLGSRLLPPGRTPAFLVLIGGLALLMPVFLAYKQSIPVLHPFSWDGTFMRWDQFLHVGRQPYEWLQPVLGHPVVTQAVDDIYFLWIHVMWVTVIWQAWHGSRTTKTRSQFLLAFVLSWIVLGTWGAVLLSSAGPVYFGAVSSYPDPYVPLMKYLHAVDAIRPLRVLRVQHFLWEAYLSPESTSLGGISAMPSMHVAVVTLLTLLGFSVNRWLGWAYAIFAFAILIGSVHLGWHYAVDGYVSIAASLAIWWLAGRIMGWWRCRRSRGSGGPGSNP